MFYNAIRQFIWNPYSYFPAKGSQTCYLLLYRFFVDDTGLATCLRSCIILINQFEVLFHNALPALGPFCSIRFCIPEVLVAAYAEDSTTGKFFGQGYHVNVKEP